MLRFRPLLVASLVLAACTDVAGIDRLLITVTVSPDRIAPGDTALIVVRFTNPTLTPLEMPVIPCISPFEISNAEGELVAGNEVVPCLAYVPPPETLKPFQSVERHAMWAGYQRRLNGTEWITEPATPGVYRVYGRLDGKLSAAAPIEVRAPVP